MEHGLFVLIPISLCFCLGQDKQIELLCENVWIGGTQLTSTQWKKKYKG